MKKPEHLLLYPDNFDDFQKLKAEKLAFGKWITPDPEFPYVYFDPVAHVYYRDEVFNNVKEENIDFYKKSCDNEKLVYRYAPFLNFIVPGEYSSIFYVQANKKSLFKKDTYQVHRISITQEMQGRRLFDFFKDRNISAKKHEDVARDADDEAIKGKIIWGDPDRHDKNMFVLNPEQKNSFRYGHIDFVRADMTGHTSHEEIETYFKNIELFNGGVNFRRGRLQKMFAEQKDLLEFHKDRFETSHYNIISARLHKADQCIIDLYF